MEYCISCGRVLLLIDRDPNGDRNAVCAKCRAEEGHDFDAEPNVTFIRLGYRVESTPEQAE